MKRRDFLGGTLATAMIPLSMTLTACADGGDETDETADSAGTDSDAASCDDSGDGTGDSNSHGHSVVIPAADLASGGGGTYTSTGGDHPHDVVLTAQDMTDLLADCSVTVTSDSGGHSHTWELSLPAA